MNDAFAQADKLAVGRLLGQPAANPTAGSVPSVVIPERGETMPGPKATEDGLYGYPGKRGQFRVMKGDVIPEGAQPVKSGQTLDAPVETASGGEGDELTLTTGELPKWYQAKVDKAMADGVLIPALQDGETQRAYEERVAAEQQPGPSENTQATGPTETADSAGPSEKA